MLPTKPILKNRTPNVPPPSSREITQNPQTQRYYGDGNWYTNPMDASYFANSNYPQVNQLRLSTFKYILNVYPEIWTRFLEKTLWSISYYCCFSGWIFYGVSKRMLLMEICGFLTLKMLSCSAVYQNKKIAVLLTNVSENVHFTWEIRY